MNRNEVLWFFILAVFSIVFGILLIGGEIALYLAPRMIIVAFFGFAALMVLTIYQGYRVIHSHKDTGGIRVYSLVFLIPIILLFTVMPDNATPSLLTNASVALTPKIELSNSNETTVTDIPTDVPTAEETEETVLLPESTDDIVKETAQTNEISVSDAKSLLPCVMTTDTQDFDAAGDTFSDDLYKTLSELKDQKMTLTGFVYKDPSFPEDTILVSRLLINCCAADASVVGFHARVEDENDYKDGEWISVTGTVKTIFIQIDGQAYEFPVLTGGTVCRSAAPEAEDAYIYP